MGTSRSSGRQVIAAGDVARAIDALAPAATAESWDNVGLLAGDPAWKTRGAIVSIDLTREALQEAIRRKYSLIVTHHAPIFPKSQGLSRVVAASHDSERSISSLVFEAVRNGISVITCHTNFDRCALEVAESVSQGLGVRPMGRLFMSGRQELLKLVVFVPDTHVAQVRAAICDAGAGQIGNYDFCAFKGTGTGSFRGNDRTRPFLGKPGVLEEAAESRLETILPRGLLKPVVAAMQKAHPYEEVAYDVYPVEQAPGTEGLVRGLGYGFWGEFSRPRAFPDLVQDVKKLFHLEGFILSHPQPAQLQKMRKVRRIAFAAGNGASVISSALARACDVFITGEAGYHAALDGSVRGMAIMEIGHRESERFFLQTMERWLKKIGLETVRLDLPTQRICNP